MNQLITRAYLFDKFFHGLVYLTGSVASYLRYLVLKLRSDKIGSNITINYDSIIIHTTKLKMGNNVSIGRRAFILAKVGLSIGSNVLIGTKAIIMPGITIGNNVVIGANSVVTKSVPSNSVAAGIPAKVIRKIK